MKLHTRPKIVTKSGRRRGRGYGSGLGGHTSGRGQKGQKTRGKIPAHFIGNSWVWFKRLPFIRGKSLFSPRKVSITLSLSDLSVFKAGEVVDRASLIKYKLIHRLTPRNSTVKLVKGGELTKKLTVKIPASPSAVEAVKSAGGQYQWPK